MSSSIDLNLHPRQSDVFLSVANEILYGGAAGGGKSHLMRVLAIVLCCEIPGFQAYLFRRESNDLEKNHLEGPKGFRSLLAPLVDSRKCDIIQGVIKFYNGSKIWLCHCKDEDDIYKYQGAEMHALFIDEATYFTEKMVRFLRSRLRVPGLNIPAHWKERLPLMVLSANPIGVGVEWVKRWFIDLQPPMAIMSMPNSEGGMRRQFVPAKLEDNPSMQLDDPQYEAKLEGLGSAALVAAMRRGDWTAVEGAYFPGFGRIILQPFELARHWNRFVSFDWGGARPFSVGWWAVSSGNWDDRAKPCDFRPGELIRYREWYGASAANVGIQLANTAIRDGIIQRSGAEQISYHVADPSIFTRRGAPSIAEDMQTKADTTTGSIIKGINWRPGYNDRIQGWRQMRDRIEGAEGRPMVWCFNTCLDSIRTIPFLVHDETYPEDLDTEGEDHAADEWRYGINSRPWKKPAPAVPEPMRDIRKATFNELLRLEKIRA